MQKESVKNSKLNKKIQIWVRNFRTNPVLTIKFIVFQNLLNSVSGKHPHFVSIKRFWKNLSVHFWKMNLNIFKGTWEAYHQQKNWICSVSESKQCQIRLSVIYLRCTRRNMSMDSRELKAQPDQISACFCICTSHLQHCCLTWTENTQKKLFYWMTNIIRYAIHVDSLMILMRLLFFLQMNISYPCGLSADVWWVWPSL